MSWGDRKPCGLMEEEEEEEEGRGVVMKSGMLIAIARKISGIASARFVAMVDIGRRGVGVMEGER